MTMPVTLLSSDEGPHPGWHDYTFIRGGKRWRLRTIDANTSSTPEEDSRSYLSVLRDDSTPKSVSFVFPQVVTPQTAYDVLGMIDRETEHATADARDKLRREIKSLLGIA